MVTSYNGFKAGDPSVFTPPGLDDSFVPGTGVQLAPGLHKGDIATILFYVASQLDARVEHGIQGTCWGYAYRQSRNDNSLISCHASGTAFDWNAPNHPMGRTGTFSPGQVSQIRAILAEVSGVVHWGGDGWGAGSTVDEMHFEIAEGTTLEALAAAVANLKTPKPPKPAPAPDPNWYHGHLGTRVLSRGCVGDDVGNLQGPILNARYPLYSKLMADGIFGPATEAVVREFQKRSKLAVDGVVGRKTFAALGVGTSF